MTNQNQFKINKDAPLYNIRILKSYLNYIQNNYPIVDIDKILDLEPKDVTEFGINRTTLWIEKEKIKKGEYDKITDKIKIKILSSLKNS